jgi:hypothetical protein
MLLHSFCYLFLQGMNQYWVSADIEEALNVARSDIIQTCEAANQLRHLSQVCSNTRLPQTCML